MRYFFTFLGGTVVGATALFLYLQGSGRLLAAAGIYNAAKARAVSGTPAVAKPLTNHPTVPPVRTPEQLQTAIRVADVTESITARDESLVIPVLGFRKEDLRNHFNDTRGGGRPHHAIDIMAPRGTPILAIDDGKIRKIFISVPGGKTLYQVDPAEQLIYYYAHLDNYAPGIVEGKILRKGQLIGYVGTTGNASPNAPHLHFSVSVLPPSKEWWKGVPIDPFPLLTTRGVTFSEPFVP